MFPVKSLLDFETWGKKERGICIRNISAALVCTKATLYIIHLLLGVV